MNDSILISIGNETWHAVCCIFCSGGYLATRGYLDFQNLVSAIGGSSSTGTQSSDLQTFLQNFQQNLSGQQNSSAAVGTFISNIA